MLAVKQLTDTGKSLFQTDSNHQTNLQRLKRFINLENYNIYATILKYRLRVYATVSEETYVYMGSLKETSVYMPLYLRKTAYMKSFKKNKKDKLKKLAKLKVQEQTRQ